MGMTFEAPATIEGGGGFLEEAGTYHVVINEVLEGQSSKGAPIDGITVTFEVLAGTSKGQESKTKQESLFAPSLKDVEKEQKNGSPCMARKKLGALLIATNLMDPAKLGQPINFEPSEMIGRQIVIKFDHQKEMDGEGKYTVETKYLQISYSDIYHVDDPAVASVPKNADALSLIPAEHRHDEAWFGWKKRKANGTPAKREAVAAGNVADDLFD